MERVTEDVQAPSYSVVVIDDAYDEEPKWDEVPLDTLEQVWQRAGFDVRPELLRDVGVEVEYSDGLEGPDIEILWERRSELPAEAERAVEELLLDFAPGPKETPDLAALKEAIAEHMMCAPVTQGTASPHPVGDIDFVFLDHVLGPGASLVESERSKSRSLEVAREVLSRAKELDKRPIMVLMSSRDPSEDEKREFRQKLDWAGDAFYFVSKREFKDGKMLFLRLAALKQRRQLGDGAQRFAEEIQDAVVRAAGNLSQAVYGLRTEDYVLIHALSLREEGEPLGDYMLWLFGAFVGKELFEKNTEVRRARRHLDELQSRELLPFHLEPSSALREMYDAALYADVGTIPSAFAKAPYGEGLRWKRIKNAPLLLGHIFRSGKNGVWAVMNAACDLAGRPGEDEKTRGSLYLPKPNLSIVLMRGHLVAIDEPTAHKGARTDLYEEGGRAHWIKWDVKHVEAVPYRDIDQWVRKTGAVLAKRLRAEHALYLQREFASEMTRVGLPVSPPIPQKTQGALYVRSSDGGCERLRYLNKPVGFVRIDRRDSSDRAEWTCTIKVAAELLNSLDQSIARVEKNRAAAEALGGEAAKNVASLRKDVNVLKGARASLPNVLARAQRFYLDPTGNASHLKGTPLAVAASYAVGGAFPPNKGCALLLNIETENKTDETEST